MDHDSTCLFTQGAAFWINPFGAANRHLAGFPLIGPLGAVAQ
jgi:hypothetical protein